MTLGIRPLGRLMNIGSLLALAGTMLLGASKVHAQSNEPVYLEATEPRVLPAGQSQDTHTFTAINRGKVPAKDVVLRVGLDEEIKFLSAKGPTGYDQAGRDLTFGAIPVLKPGEKASWTITFQLDRANYVARFKGRLEYKLESERIIPGCTSTLYFPSGEATGSAIRAEKSAPCEVIAGDPFTYTITVTNIARQALGNVTLTDTLPTNFAFASAEPAATPAGGQLTWTIGGLKAGETRTVLVRGTATSTEDLKNCINVSYTSGTCITTKVVQPGLELAKTGPAEVLLCDPIPYVITVRNPGTGPATNVVINDTLPEGIVTQDGKTSFSIPVGTLAGGQTRQFRVSTKATRTGAFTNTAVATADRGLTAQASASTTVRQPVLQITKTGSERTYLGQTLDYTVTVTSTGDTPATNTVVTDTLPANAAVVKAEGAAAGSGTLTWTVGTLNPGESKTFSYTLRGTTIGTLNNTARATATCAQAVAATHTATVVGIPAVLLEVVDINDPVRVGDETTYVITVTNQGSADDTNIRITAKTEAEQQLISSSGVTPGTINGANITFAPVPVLKPKEKVSWQVRVKAVGEADARFSVEMNTDNIKRPVNETESTNLYR